MHSLDGKVPAKRGPWVEKCAEYAEEAIRAQNQQTHNEAKINRKIKWNELSRAALRFQIPNARCAHTHTRTHSLRQSLSNIFRYKLLFHSRRCIESSYRCPIVVAFLFSQTRRSSVLARDHCVRALVAYLRTIHKQKHNKNRSVYP